MFNKKVILKKIRIMAFIAFLNYVYLNFSIKYILKQNKTHGFKSNQKQIRLY